MREEKNNFVAIIIIGLAIILIGLGIFLFKKMYKGKENNVTTTTTTTTTTKVIEQVTLSFDSNGGEKVQDSVIEKGKTASLPIANRKGYTFVKWVDENGNEVTDSTTFDKDSELKAVWKKTKKTKKTVVVQPVVKDPVVNVVKYENIPEKGKLVDLDKKGILSNVYGLSKTSLENTYTKDGFANAEYKLDENGVLTITYPGIDIVDGVYGTNYLDPNFNTINTVRHYTNNKNYVAYKYPTNDLEINPIRYVQTSYSIPLENSKGRINEIADLLNDVLDVNPSNYTGYKYSNNNISLFVGLPNFKDETLYPNETYTDIKTVTNDMVDRDFTQFNGLVNAINTYKNNGGDISKLKATYSSNGTLYLTQVRNITNSHNVDTRDTSLDGLSENEKNAITSMLGKFDPPYISLATNASDIPYSVIEEIAGSNPDETNGNDRTFTADEINAAKAIKDVIDDAFSSVTDANGDHPTEFKLADLNGENGITIEYTSTETEELSFPGGDNDSSRSQRYNRNASNIVSINNCNSNYAILGNPPIVYSIYTNDTTQNINIIKDLLKDVFNVNSNNYISFEYTNGNISLYKKLKYFRDELVKQNESYTDTKNEVTDDMIDNDFTQFDGLVDAVNNYINNGGQKFDLIASYSSDGTMTLSRKTNNKIINVDTRDTSLDGLSENEKNAITSMLGKFVPPYISLATNASDIPYSVIEEIAGSTPDETNSIGRTFTADEINAARAIKAVIDDVFNQVTDSTDNHANSFKLIDLNGENGITIEYTSTEIVSVAISTFNRIPDIILAENVVTNTDFVINTPTYVFKNQNEYGKSYIVPNNSLTATFMGNNNAIISFINGVFPDTSNIVFNTNYKYTMSISNTGKITIRHNGIDNITIPIDSKFTLNKNEDGTFTYTSIS